MEIKSSTKKVAKNVNRPLYIAFMIGGIYFLITKEFSQAVSFWGIALAFDPFDIKVPFPKRPFYQ